MAQFVIDNSVVMSWCFESERTPYTDRVLDALCEMEAVVPAIWPLEAGNVLLVAERRNKLQASASERFVSFLQRLPIRVEQETPGRMLNEILSLARRHGLSSYDASYLDLAVRLNLSIATVDRSLSKAAEACGLSIFEGA